jgi:hypothetical protein
MALEAFKSLGINFEINKKGKAILKQIVNSCPIEGEEKNF